MSYLHEHPARPDPAVAAHRGPGAELGRRLRLGRRRLGAPRRFLILGTRGRLVLRARAHADARERARSLRCIGADGAARGRAHRRDRTRAARPRTTRRCSRWRWPPARRRARPARALAALPEVAASARTCSTSPSTSRRFGGWGRGLRCARRRAGTTDRPPDRLAYQAVKYRQPRRLVAPRPAPPRAPGRAGPRGNPTLAVSRRARAAVRVDRPRRRRAPALPRLVRAFARAQARDDAARESAALDPRVRPAARGVPTETSTAPEVWEALLPRHAMTALMRNLAHDDRGRAARARCRRGTARGRSALGDARAAAPRARAPARGAGRAADLRAGSRRARQAARGSRSAQIVDALDAAFYPAFGNVEPTGSAHAARARRVGLDDRRRRSPACRASRRASRRRRWRWSRRRPSRTTSSSRSRGPAAGPVAPRGGGDDGLTPLAISPRQRLDDGVATVDGLPFGGTDCALPMLLGAGARLPVDIFWSTRTARPGRATSTRSRRCASTASRWASRAKLVVVGMDVERVHDRRPGRRRHARRRRFRHRDAVGHRRLRPRRALKRARRACAGMIAVMPWIPPLDESGAPEGSRATADAHAATGGRVTNMKWTLAHSPAALDALLEWYPLHDEVVPFLGERAHDPVLPRDLGRDRLPDLLDVLPPPADRRRRGSRRARARRARRADRRLRPPARHRPARGRRRELRRSPGRALRRRADRRCSPRSGR